MKLRPQPSSGGLLLWMKTLLHLFAAKFESPETREFKKLKRFIAG
jgi:hypothetical protein